MKTDDRFFIPASPSLPLNPTGILMGGEGRGEWDVLICCWFQRQIPGKNHSNSVQIHLRKTLLLIRKQSLQQEHALHTAQRSGRRGPKATLGKLPVIPWDVRTWHVRHKSEGREAGPFERVRCHRWDSGRWKFRNNLERTDKCHLGSAGVHTETSSSPHDNSSGSE